MLTARSRADRRGEFTVTNRLRTEGTDHLLSAGQAVGVRRFIAQSVATYGTYAPTGGAVKSEDDPRGASNAKAKRELGWQPAHAARWPSSRRCSPTTSS